ncbi:MAG: efflux RND transporter periplasmic adaptor subunit [Coprobacter sp.]|nr:efflux RND transporter periplasmic adaptor subunit [Coprobacter sp.]
MSNESKNIYSGIVKAAHEINLGFKTAGQLEEILVKEGDYVQKGQLLAKLDDADYKLGVEALQIQYDQVCDEVERTKKLYEQKSVSANDYEKAVAGLKQLGIQLQVNKNKLDYTSLYAPTDGYIRSVNFAPAEMVDAGTALFSMLDVSSMEVVADIPVGEYRQRKNFENFTCRACGIDDEIAMNFLSLSPKADGNQLYQLHLSFDKAPHKQLTAGMNVEIEITIRHDNATTGYTIPAGAIFKEGNSAYVWTLSNDSVVNKTPVVLGNIDSNGRAIILEGLTGDEQIVRAGVNMLQDGDKVSVIESPKKSNVGGLL